MEVVVIGGNAAGASAARSIARHNPLAHITVLDRSAYTPYATCSMLDLISGKINDWRQLCRSPQDQETPSRIEARRQTEALSIDPHRRTVAVLENHHHKATLHYDYLVLAAGSRPKLPPSTSDASPVFPLRELSDAIRINEFLLSRPLEQIAVLGAGPIGIALAVALRTRGIQVTLVDAAELPVPWLHPSLSLNVAQRLQAMGIPFRAKHEITCVSEIAGGVEIHSQSNDSFRVQAAVSALGFLPAVELAKEARLAIGRSGAIAVSQTLKTNDEHIYAAGDCAEARHFITGHATTSFRASIAAQQGRIIGYRMAGMKISAPQILRTIFQRFPGFDLAAAGFNAGDQRSSAFRPRVFIFEAPQPGNASSPPPRLTLALYYLPETYRLIGAQAVGPQAAHVIRAAIPALFHRATLEDIVKYDLGYHPEIGTLWDPLITASYLAYRRDKA